MRRRSTAASHPARRRPASVATTSAKPASWPSASWASSAWWPPPCSVSEECSSCVGCASPRAGALQPRRAPRTVDSARSKLEALKTNDPDFSIVSFEDFAYALYAEAHTARGAGKLDTLAPYLQDSARRSLAAARAESRSRPSWSASMRYDDVQVNANGARVVIEFEANFTETPSGAPPQSSWLRESWVLTRKAEAKSRPPDRVRVFSCPNCGGPLDRVVGSTCGYCQAVVDTGAFDWVVSNIYGARARSATAHAHGHDRRARQ